MQLDDGQGLPSTLLRDIAPGGEPPGTKFSSSYNPARDCTTREKGNLALSAWRQSL